MHKALLNERKYDEAIRCLEVISKAEQTPKIQFAIAKLNLAHRKPTRLIPYSAKITNNFRLFLFIINFYNFFRSIVEHVPEALLCKTFLILSGNSKFDDDVLPKRLNTIESLAWIQAKQAEAKRNFPLAIQILNKPSFSNHYK